ncbi:mitochondrial carrier domain-containing protein [Mycena pura]|uniref:Mitochondrial carrier domain-containing protein n=1 Tax=Mycena pura TaxID=153505 RepID=A0AAD6XYI6_9AGAR|nr:mitochondrial carrier domain-containing protein [Mycena pura]
MLDFLWYPLAFLFALSAMILPTAIIFGITMPFIGVLVRYRANYIPKRVQLPGEDVAREDRSSDSYFGMFKRVHRLEGWAGLYKGIMPSIVCTFIMVVAVTPVLAVLSLTHKVLPTGNVYMFADGYVPALVSYGLATIPVLLLIPMQIIINRAITTPHRLGAFAPKDALHVLLSPAERAKPLRLYLTPGVALIVLLAGIIAPTVNLAWTLVAPRLPHAAWRLPLVGVALPMILLTTALLTPLEVMLARLTLQRLGEAEPAPAVPAGEEVMEFRIEQAPYTSLLDCARTMVREEGARVLFRAWWLTALGVAVPFLLPPAIMNK